MNLEREVNLETVITFDSVMKFTRTISSETAFDEDACKAYYDLLAALPSGGIVVEIGLQFGRSSSIALQVAAQNNLAYWGVDPFIEPPEAKAAWQEMRQSLPPARESHLLIYPSSEVMAWPGSIDLALIDGNHEFEGVMEDCRIILPKISSGGHVCFHDYGRESLPGVMAAVTRSIDSRFRHIGTFGTLGVFKRVI